jgi:SAM-dependent methyltransferase
MTLNKKFIINLSSIYFTLGILFYFLTKSKPISFIFESIFNKNLSFFVDKKKETIDKYVELFDEKYFHLLLIFPLTILIIFSIIKVKEIIFSKNNLDEISHLKPYNLNYLIAVAAGLGLYLELMIIRLHSTYFQLFSFFKNISLLSCLLGLGIGYLFGHKKINSLKWVFPLLALQIIFMYLVKNTPLSVLLQNPIAEQWAMGQDRAQTLFQFLLIYSFVIIIFLSNAIIFVPLGHLVSRLMHGQDKLKSYSWNLIGSLSGIIIFSFMSFIWTPPSLWILVGFFVFIIFIRKTLIEILIPSVSTLILLFIILVPTDLSKQEIYSPYQLVSLQHNYSTSSPTIDVMVSNTWYQTPYDVTGKIKYNPPPLAANYKAPYSIRSKIPKKILIVGSGTGNDTAYALERGVSHIDAVEIDPAIIHIGKKYHPQRPYQSKKVNVIQNDARNFIQHTKNKYDLIVYGMLDSHSSLSGRGGIRLDSYVYTVESFREARKTLTGDGYLSLSFNLSEAPLGLKIYAMLTEAFDGKEPLVISHFKQSTDNFKMQPYAFLIGKNIDKNFKIENPDVNQVTFFGNKSELSKIDISTDNWPFFYMPKKIWPKSYIFIIFLIFLSSFFLINRTNPINKSNFSPVCFFLGAGFMLVETKGITELALVYGSTWFVVSIVIACVLIMAYLANLLVINNTKIKLWLIYTLIFFTIILGYLFTLIDHGTLSPVLQKILTPTMLTLPMFFSGMAFSKQLSTEKAISIALSSNILGAIFGGLLEYNAMYFGYRSLYVLGFLMYLSAFIFSKKRFIN